mmetsp:Transcript_5197/g.8848  ORF Transcript_5197/g.8848 Transcript_5197/m.8848 type:complete len:135 (+) Transcript_5197:770-1174(+)
MGASISTVCDQVDRGIARQRYRKVVGRVFVMSGDTEEEEGRHMQSRQHQVQAEGSARYCRDQGVPYMVMIINFFLPFLAIFWSISEFNLTSASFVASFFCCESYYYYLPVILSSGGEHIIYHAAHHIIITGNFK